MNSIDWYTRDPWKAYMSWFSPRWAWPIDEFDPKQWVEKLKRGGFRIAVLHAKHHDGICFFPSRFRERNPPRDYIAEFVTEAHRQDLRVLAYYGIAVDVWSSQVHPDWCCLDRDGKPYDFKAPYLIEQGFCCLNNPGFRELVLGQLEEIQLNSNCDGIWLDSCHAGPEEDGCFCDFCRRDFAKVSGGRSLEDMCNTPEHLLWKRDTILELMRAIRKIADHDGTHRPLTYNGCGANLFPGYDEIDKLCDSLSSEADGPFMKSFSPRTLAPRKQKRGLFEHYTPFTPGLPGWVTRPKNMLLVEASLLNAHGGSVLGGFDVTPTGDFSEFQMDTLGEVAAYLRERQEYIDDPMPVYDVGLMVKDARTFDAMWAQTLLARQLPFGIVLPDRIDLSPYRLVIVNEDFPINEAALDQLEAFLEAGGSLLVAPRALPERTETSTTQRFLALLGLAGVDCTGFESTYLGDLHANVAGTLSAEPVRCDGTTWKLIPAGADVLARYVHPTAKRTRETWIWWGPNPPQKTISDHAALTINRVGHGRAMCMGFPLAKKGDADGLQRHRLVQLTYNLIDHLIDDPLLRSEAPSQVEVVVNRQDHRHIVHLINKYTISSSVHDRPDAPPTLANVTVWVNENRIGPVGRIVRAPQNTEIKVDRDGPWLRLTANELAIQEIFVLEPAS